MAGQSSRTYKLRLSDRGIDLFLDCHCRLAHLAREFVPYGSTLHVAVTLLDAMEPSELAAVLADPLCDQISGSSVRFVGSPPQLTSLTQGLIARLVASGEVFAPPAVGRLYLAALLSFESADDHEILSAHRRAKTAPSK